MRCRKELLRKRPLLAKQLLSLELRFAHNKYLCTQINLFLIIAKSNQIYIVITIFRVIQHQMQVFLVPNQSQTCQSKFVYLFICVQLRCLDEDSLSKTAHNGTLPPLLLSPLPAHLPSPPLLRTVND